jgi:hypothetical protein
MRTIACIVSLSALIGFAVGTAQADADEDDNPYIQRQLAAKKLSEPPVIDGDLSDSVWQEAATGDRFTDQKTMEEVADQTKFWLGYDENAIYLAVYSYDSDPDAILMAETKRDAGLWRDDHIQFEIDAYHSHNWGDFSSFSVNARGTQNSEMGGGRSGKTEWKGDWQAASKVTKDGWVTEMSIPWAILTYPGKEEPTTLGFNVRRNHARDHYDSQFSNIGRTWRNEWAGDWVGVQLPASIFEPELLILPFLAAGAAERDDVFDETARGGLDLRYRPTPQITALAAVNPDFRNVEGEVEGIDFTRGERFVDESRPFFQEGRRMFRSWSGMGDYFYSRRIENIDLGTKLYGKLAKRTNLGFLGAFDFADQHDDPWAMHRQDYLMNLSQGFGEGAGASVMTTHRNSAREKNSVWGYQANTRITRNTSIQGRYGSSAWRGVELADDETEVDPDGELLTYLRGDLAQLSVDAWNEWFFMNLDTGFLSPGFRSSNGFFEYQGRRNTGFFMGGGNEFRDSVVRRVGVDLFANYAERYSEGNGFDGMDSFMTRALSTIGDRDSNDAFFRDNVGYWTGVWFDNNLSLRHSANIGHFREEGAEVSDRDWSTNWNVNFESEDRNRRIRVGYGFGRADEARRHFPSIGGSWKREAFSVSLNASVLRHTERRQQHILGLNYDISETVGIGGRLVFRRDDNADENTWNPYISFRRSGQTGIETFLILGDPSGDSFTPRMEGKVLFPL